MRARRPRGGVPSAGTSGASDRSAKFIPAREYFTELAEIRSAGRKLTEEEWIAMWARHDQYPA